MSGEEFSPAHHLRTSMRAFDTLTMRELSNEELYGTNWSSEPLLTFLFHCGKSQATELLDPFLSPHLWNRLMSLTLSLIFHALAMLPWITWPPVRSFSFDASRQYLTLQQKNGVTPLQTKAKLIWQAKCREKVALCKSVASSQTSTLCNCVIKWGCSFMRA